MKSKGKMEKMFGVLVLGGMFISASAESACCKDARELKKCETGLEEELICGDGKTQQELAEIIEEIEERSCEVRKFCQCWEG